jgi:NADH:ubiquinone oxidoreductase subunit 3 (subunit A)
MAQLILSPPIVLIVLIISGVFFSHMASTLSAKGELSTRKGEAYACGQRDVTHNVSPDYRQFFPVAFFFTIMHVLVLVVATAPKGVITLPLLYIAAGVVALIITIRR